MFYLWYYQDFLLTKKLSDKTRSKIEQFNFEVHKIYTEKEEFFYFMM